MQMPGLGAPVRRRDDNFTLFAKQLAYPSFVWFGVEGLVVCKIIGLGVPSSGGAGESHTLGGAGESRVQGRGKCRAEGSGEGGHANLLSDICTTL